MNVIVCTLFEGHYHYGVAALVNSLYKQGFRGDIFAGYKGTLPTWAGTATYNEELAWEAGKTLQVADNLRLHFLPIQSEFHLTNFKPFFMLKLMEEVALGADAITYFDPDIVVKCNWTFFQTWMSHGVALVHEIINNDMPPSHPIRMEWGKVIRSANREVTRNLYSYINGGFCGVGRQYLEFLRTWIDITNTAIRHYNLTPGQWAHNYNRTYIFYAQDQDTLNVTAMCSESPISEMGPEAMDFAHGGFTMSHSVGSPKPWKKKFFSSFFKGIAPSIADKNYWNHVHGPILIYSTGLIKLNRSVIKATSFLSRFYNVN